MMRRPTTWIKGGGVTSAKGYQAAGVASGIKKKGQKDMAMIFSECDAELGATFTTNQIKAAPVKLSMLNARGRKVRGVIINGGNANACTGVRGIKDASEMVDLSAQTMGVGRTEMLVCSTGRIGVPLPMDKVRKGIRKLHNKLAIDGGRAAAKAIMTSDTFHKECAVSLVLGGEKVVIGAMAKGAGMIHPNMATMLCCVCSDVALSKRVLQQCTQQAVERTFNRISVDGDMSTNDTVLVMANGSAGNDPVTSMSSLEAQAFLEALVQVMGKLSRMIVKDGEGITKVVDLVIKGAATNADAKRISEAIARSPLVKTSWYGCDPNWGRLMDVIGYSGAKVREETVDIYYDGLVAVKGGVVSRTPVSRLKKVVKKKNFTITIHLHLGKGEYQLLVNDLSERYVVFNMSE